MNNIVLIGMPGSGKSTLGVLLAKTLAYSFIDSDLLIQSQQNKKLYQIIEQKGLDYFIKAERDAILTINADNTVIATGGSAVLNEESMKHLSKMGIILYLEHPAYEIEKRIKNINTRGIVMRKNETISEIYAERVPLYQKYADITVNLESSDTERSLEKILEKLDKII